MGGCSWLTVLVRLRRMERSRFVIRNSRFEELLLADVVKATALPFGVVEALTNKKRHKPLRVDSSQFVYGTGDVFFVQPSRS